MGLIGQLLDLVFGSGRNLVRETAEVFRENAEAGAVRDKGLRDGALAQFAAEFAARDRGGFDRFMDGLNRVPRPMLAFGTLGLFAAAMTDPVWFASRMQGLALVPEPLWWLLGAVVSFYFGARHQVKTQAFQRDMAETLARAPQVTDAIARLESLRPASSAPAAPGVNPSQNPALADWRVARGEN